MASFKITDLTELTSGSVADTDVLEIVDLDADQSKKVTIASLKTVFSGGGVSEGSAYTGGTANGIMFNDGNTFATSTNLLYSETNGLLLSPSGTIVSGFSSGLNINNANPTFRLTSGTQGFGFFQSGSVTYIARTTNAWTSVTYDGSFRNGRFGMGTTNPQALIHGVNTTDIVAQRIDLANGQTADAFQINSYGNTGGDLFRVAKGGLIAANGTNSQPSTTYTLTNVVTNGTKTITYDSNSNVKVGDTITGTNIATAAHIISVESDTEARMNVIATGSGTNSATIIPMFAGIYSNVTLSKNAGISSYYSAGLFVSPTDTGSGSSIKSAGAYIDNPSSSATTTGMYLSSKSDTILTFNRNSPSTGDYQWYASIGNGASSNPNNARGDFYIGAGEFFAGDGSHSLRIDDLGLAIGGIGYLSSDTANQAFTIWGGISTGGNVLNVRWRAGNTIYNTSGNVNLIAIDSTLNGQDFKPTSGTGTISYINLSPEINQTGGASGISRGIYINPTLTSAADFRAIEVTDGNVVLALPTSSAGLPSGALWNDSGTVKIV